MGFRRAIWPTCFLAGLMIAAGCARHHKPVGVPVKPTVARPAPPAGAAPGLAIPTPKADGSFDTINSGIDPQEAIWHLRAALNVAALACGGDSGAITAYNRLLKDRKTVLASAYQIENARFRSEGPLALDQHMTRLYNFFAQPPAQQGFCRAARAEAARIGTVPASAFSSYAPEALDRLEAPIIAFYRVYDEYRRDLAGWHAGPHTSTATIAPSRDPPQTRVAGNAGWRIQIGAFTGRKAAEDAWTRARARVPRLAGYRPRYEKVPGREDLVRLQLGAADDRAGALDLCAAAAAGGFDCLPVAQP